MHADGAARNYIHCVHIFSDIFKNNDASQRVNVVTLLFNASSSPFNAFPPPFHAYRRSLTPLCRPLSLPIDPQRLFVVFYVLFVEFSATPWPFRTSPSHLYASPSSLTAFCRPYRPTPLHRSSMLSHRYSTHLTFNHQNNTRNGSFSQNHSNKTT